MMREADLSLLTYAGSESAIPATKSFTNQLVLLQLIAIAIGKLRGSSAELQRVYRSLQELPSLVSAGLRRWPEQAIHTAERYRNAASFMFVGRGVHYAIAREGALKMKETAYRQAEAYPAGELRHGPQALVSPKIPLLVIATQDLQDPDSVIRYQKTVEIARETRAKGGDVIALVNEGDRQLRELVSTFIEIPASHEYSLAILETIPLQLLACNLALLDGIDPDRPRNLSKAVTRT